MGTKFSFEVPLNHLEDFEPFQDFYFALSFLCKKSTEYLNYFLGKKVEGKKIFLDNSFNELRRPESSKELANLSRILNADMVISPDCDGWSLKELGKAYDELSSMICPEKILVVVKSMEEERMFRERGVLHFCTTYEQRPGLDKILLYKSFHFLGLRDFQEIEKYQPYTCDTGVPVKLALEGKDMYDWAVEGHPHAITTPDFFDLTLTKKELNLARRNCQWIRARVAP